MQVGGPASFSGSVMETWGGDPGVDGEVAGESLVPVVRECKFKYKIGSTAGTGLP